jgi:competence protein ComEA
MTATADRATAAKLLNLAALVHDGDKLYVPKIGEAVTLSVLGATRDALVNVNTADATGLMTLKGVGKARADAITAHRPYRSFDDFLARSTLPKTVSGELKSLISF